MKLVVLFSVLAASSAFWLACSPSSSSAEELVFEPRRVVKPFPALTDPRFVPVAEARGMADDELVIGVRIGGAARAYPINMLTGPTREIINDQLGGRAIAATW